MSMSRVRVSTAGFAFIAVSILAASGMPPSSASSDATGIGAPFVPDEILLKFSPGARALDRASARAQVNAGRLRTFRGGAEHWKLGAGINVEQAIEKLRRHPLVDYAEPNFLLRTDVVPNDPRLGDGRDLQLLPGAVELRGRSTLGAVQHAATAAGADHRHASETCPAGPRDSPAAERRLLGAGDGGSELRA
jgi:hypothetical protein